MTGSVITVTVCVGSSCFKRGAGEIVDAFKKLVEENNLEGQVELKGCFCLERCTEGTTVKIEDRLFLGVFAREIPRLFREEVLTRL
jgi:NADH-quinone oxidoreductase subunit G